MSMREFQSYLEANIPLAGLTGYQLLKLDRDSAEALSPMDVNGNHRGSAFGGSLYNSMVLTAYSWLYGGLLDFKSDYSLLIQEGSIDYLKEVRSEIFCICRSPGGHQVDTFLKSIDSKGKGRIFLECEVKNRSTDEVLASFRGRFVALKKQS